MWVAPDDDSVVVCGLPQCTDSVRYAMVFSPAVHRDLFPSPLAQDEKEEGEASDEDGRGEEKEEGEASEEDESANKKRRTDALG